MIIILNSSVLTNFGEYKYTPISIKDAGELLKQEGYVSAVGHEQTAKALSKLLGFDVPVNRVEYNQQPGEKAFVFKIKRRLAVGEIAEADALRPDEYETGLLEKLK